MDDGWLEEDRIKKGKFLVAELRLIESDKWRAKVALVGEVWCPTGSQRFAGKTGRLGWPHQTWPVQPYLDNFGDGIAENSVVGRLNLYLPRVAF